MGGQTKGLTVIPPPYNWVRNFFSRYRNTLDFCDASNFVNYGRVRVYTEFTELEGDHPQCAYVLRLALSGLTLV